MWLSLHPHNDHSLDQKINSNPFKKKPPIYPPAADSAAIAAAWFLRLAAITATRRLAS